MNEKRITLMSNLMMMIISYGIIRYFTKIHDINNHARISLDATLFFHPQNMHLWAKWKLMNTQLLYSIVIVYLLQGNCWTATQRSSSPYILAEDELGTAPQWTKCLWSCLPFHLGLCASSRRLWTNFLSRRSVKTWKITVVIWRFLGFFI